MVGILLEPELLTGPSAELEAPVGSLLLAWPGLELDENAGAEVIDVGVPELACALALEIVDHEEYSAPFVNEVD